MDILEGILLVAGGIVFVLSFFLPTKEEKQPRTGKLAEEEIKKLVAQEMETVRSHVDDVVEEAVGYAVEKTERSLERLSNEKIMAVNEYSDTVLAEIHRNHEEAMFLYDMLNNKHSDIKATVSEVNRTVKEAEETVNTIRRPQPGAQKPAAENPAGAEKLQKTGKAEAPARAAKPQKAGETEKSAAAQAPEKTEEPVGEKPGRRPDPAKGQEPMELVSFIREYEGNNSNDRIMELHGQGKSNVAIAKELGLGVGEVKLVVDLFKNQKQGEEINA